MKNGLHNKLFKILAIETSCDETSASIIKANFKVKNLKFKILSNIISSQIKIHAKYGGVYPELASREHVKNILPVIEEAILNSNNKIQILSQTQNSKFKTLTEKWKLKIENYFDVIAVTSGPGLIGSLLVGVNTAKTLAFTLKKPIYSINHIEGHIYANFIGEISNLKSQISKLPKFPLVALIVSGGHTSLVYMKNHLDYKVIGETLDDAAGEAFDKVAKLLNLGYPGGPAISAMAEKFPISLPRRQAGNSQFSNKSQSSKLKFPRPMIDSGDFDFSFSGLKTAVLYAIKKLPKPLGSKTKAQICIEFQDAVVETLVAKTIESAKKYKAKSILLCGGVASNDLLRKKLKVESEKLKVDFFTPQKNLCTDNAAMVGIAAAYKIALGKRPTPWYNVNANSNLKLGK